jgi:hypothetical protein
MAFRTVKGRRGEKTDYAYLFDANRGVEVLKIKGGIKTARKMKSVTAPSVKRDRFASQPVGSLGRSASFDEAGDPASYVCPLFL